MTSTDETWQDFLRSLSTVRAIQPSVGMEITRNESEDDDTLGVMRGHFSVFNAWYRIDSLMEGRFLERVAPGAFSKTIAESRQNMRVLFDHGMDPTIGNKVLGPIRDLREDDRGAFYEVPLFDTSYNRDLLPGLKAGAYGASFRFTVVKDKWDDAPERSQHNPDGIPERTILETRTMEFGPVTFPASASATAGVRSMTDEFYDHVQSRDPDQYQKLLLRAQEIRTPAAPEAAPGTSPDESRTPLNNEPPSSTRRDRSEDHKSVLERLRKHITPQEGNQ